MYKCTCFTGNSDFKAANLCEILFDLEDEMDQQFSSLSISSVYDNVADSKNNITPYEEELPSEELQSTGNYCALISVIKICHTVTISNQLILHYYCICDNVYNVNCDIVYNVNCDIVYNVNCDILAILFNVVNGQRYIVYTDLPINWNFNKFFLNCLLQVLLFPLTYLHC